MKKHVIALFILLVLAMGMSVKAIEPRLIQSRLTLNFNGNTALCYASCTGNKASDKIDATLTLYSSTGEVQSWSNSDNSSVSFTEQHNVKQGTSYTLTLTYSVNGIEQSPKSITKTCP